MSTVPVNRDDDAHDGSKEDSSSEGRAAPTREPELEDVHRVESCAHGIAQDCPFGADVENIGNSSAFMQ